MFHRFKRSCETPDDAAAWLARMRSDTRTEEDEARFERWLAEDPEHEREYLELEMLWSDFDHFAEAPGVVNMRLAAKADARRSANQSGSRMPRRSLVAVVSSVLLAAVVALIVIVLPIWYLDAAYKTVVGDRQTVSLADGSEVVLDTDSFLRVRYRPWVREVTLDRGQAFFKVAHSTLRPFDVQAASSRIRAVGTAFDVLVKDDTARVTLIEGQVEVIDQLAAARQTPTRPVDDSAHSAIKSVHTVLNAGQTVAIRPAGISEVKPASLVKATAWLEGRLVFENETLQDAVAEVNRYSPVRLVVIDEKLAGLRLSGVFRAGRAETFVESLRASFAVETRLAADGSLILQPAERASPLSLREKD